MLTWLLRYIKFNTHAAQSDNLEDISGNVIEPLKIEKLAAVENLERNSTIITIIVNGVGISLIILIMIYLIRQLSLSLKELSEVADRLKDGDLTRKAHIRSLDEIGTLGVRFNEFIETIKNIVSGIKNAGTRSVAVKENIREESETARTSTNEITQGVESIMNQISNLDNLITDSSSSLVELSKNVSALTAQIESQTGAVSESSSSVEEMIASLQNVAKVCAAKHETTESLLKLSGEGSVKIDKTNSMIQGIASDIDEILVQEQKSPIDGILVMDHPVAGLVIGLGVYAFRK